MAKTKYSEFGNVVLAWSKHRNFSTVRKLLKAADIDLTYQGQLMKVSKPTEITVNKLAKALNIPPSYLLEHKFPNQVTANEIIENSTLSLEQKRQAHITVAELARYLVGLASIIVLITIITFFLI